MIRHSTFQILAIALALGLPLIAGDSQAADRSCHGIDDPNQRLACYDRVTGRPDRPVEAASANPTADTSAPSDRPEPRDPLPQRHHPDGARRVAMAEHWETDDAHHGGLFQVRAHEPVYALPVRYSTHPNRLPRSPAPGRTLAVPLDLDPIEAKFQISLKTKALDNILGANLDLWFGYTQLANWQAYNGIESSPFRETNYRPEAFLTFGPNLELFGGWRWQVLNLGLIHESNGRSQPLSRSWNRIYAQFGLENGNLSIYARPWWRLDETAADDDNPDIRRFMGRHDLRLVYARNGHDFALLSRYSFDGGRGSIQADWHFPLLGQLKGYLQLTSGYGETLIDYNHKQTTLGVGVSLVEAR